MKTQTTDLQTTGDPRLPVALVTGFLGSGKTTLLNRLLHDPAMRATAVVINEFGDVPLDQHFVDTTDGEIVVMANGCLCCSVQDDIEGVIGRLFARRDQGPVPAFERMLIETSGLADPAPIMQMLLNQPLVMDNFRLDSVVTLVDAVNGSRQIAENEEAFKQVVLADRLVLSKTDLASEAVVAALRRELSAINPGAQQLVAIQGNLSPDHLFGAGRLDSVAAADRWVALDRAARELREREARSGEPASHGGHGGDDPLQGGQGVRAHEAAHHHHDHHHGEHAHTRGVVCCTLEFPRALPWRELNRWLTAFRIRHGERLLRVKGIVELEGEPWPMALHGVHHVFHPPLPLPHLRGKGLHGTRLVVITRDLGEDAIRASWQEFITKMESA